MYLMKLDIQSLETLRKASESKQVKLENPLIVKTKYNQYPLILDKGQYSDYITPNMVTLKLDEIEEVYLIMEFRSAYVHDVLIHTEKYDVVEFDMTCFESLLSEM